MTRDEYMTALKNNIQSLTVDEQNEALQYYADYFEDAADDEKVMAELGSPEEVAAIIREKFSNTLVGTSKTGNEEKSDSEKGSEDESCGALYYEFDENEVRNVEFGFGAAEVVLISGKKFAVETRGMAKENLLCRLDTGKTLVVKNLNKLYGLRFFNNHDRSNRIVPRILITIPENAKLGYFKASIGAGNFVSKDANFGFEKGKVEVGAGNFVLGKVNGNAMNIRCGMGNLKIEGSITGRSDIDCGMGAIKLELSGDSDAYSFDAKVGLGDFKFNNEKRSGVCQVYADKKRENHFSVNVGMGSVNILMNK